MSCAGTHRLLSRLAHTPKIKKFKRIHSPRKRCQIAKPAIRLIVNWRLHLKLHQEKGMKALHLACVGIPVGVIVGLSVAAYDFIVNTLLWNRFEAQLSLPALCFLPLIGMILTGLLSRFGKLKNRAMANEVVRIYHDSNEELPGRSMLPKLLASIATLASGCSAGMEGASKWLGAFIGAHYQDRCNRGRWSGKYFNLPFRSTLLAGAAAGIAAIFRAPLSGAVMGLESPYKKGFASEHLLLAFVASSFSYLTFTILRDGATYFPIHYQYILQTKDLLLCVPLGLLAGVSSIIFLKIFYRLSSFKNEMSKYPLFAEAIAGLFLTAIALFLWKTTGAPSSLGSGLALARKMLSDPQPAQVLFLIFLGKMLATAITFGLGGVGGLFVPSATIGIALGSLFECFFPPSQPGLFALLGLSAFTGASYNSLLFSLVFLAEATGQSSLLAPALVSSSVAYLVSHGISNSPTKNSQIQACHFM